MSHNKIVGRDNTNHLSEVKVHNGALKTGLDTTDTGFLTLAGYVDGIEGKLDSLITGTNIKGTDGSSINGDGSGNIKANIINSININPANSSNGEHANHSGHSVSVMPRCRTDIADHTTGVFLLADANGHQQVDIANQPNFKLEDLSSSLNAQHASGSGRSMATTLKARTDITDHNASIFIKADSEGKVMMNQPLENDVIDASLAVPNATPTNTSVITIESKPYKGKISVVFESSIAGSALLITPQWATSSGGTYYNFDLSHTEEFNSGNAKILILKDFVPPFVKVSLSQSSGVSVNYKVSAIY